MRERFRAEQDRALGEELARVDLVEAESWTAWRETRSPEYLRLALDCVKQQCAMLGFHHADRGVQVAQNTVVQLVWGGPAEGLAQAELLAHHGEHGGHGEPPEPALPEPSG